MRPLATAGVGCVCDRLYAPALPLSSEQEGLSCPGMVGHSPGTWTQCQLDQKEAKSHHRRGHDLVGCLQLSSGSREKGGGEQGLPKPETSTSTKARPGLNPQGGQEQTMEGQVRWGQTVALWEPSAESPGSPVPP